MNERIFKLALKAMDFQGAVDTDTELKLTNSELEKFAELIVAECMEQINKVEEKGDAHLGGGYFYDGTQLCRDAIKQHFGVEE